MMDLSKGVFILEKWSNRIVLILIISFIVDQLYSIQSLYILNAILTVIVMVSCMNKSKKQPKLYSALMLGIGSIILFIQGVEGSTWIASITKNLPLVSLIIIVPILSAPINLGQYDNKVSDFIATFSKKPHLIYLCASILFYILGPITNLGSIHIVHSMLQKVKLPVEFLGRVYVRGFSSINTWAPYFASVFLVVYYLEIPMYTFLPYGLLLSVFQLLTAYILFATKEVGKINIETSRRSTFIEMNKLNELFIILLLLIGVIFFLEPYFNVNVSVIIIITAVIFAAIWSLYLQQFQAFLHKANSFRQNILSKQANEITLFLSAGFFGEALANTFFSEYLNVLWGYLAHYSVLILIFSTIVLVSVFSFLGIHQIVIISSILASVSPTYLGMDEITLAMILLSSWAIAGTVSPITPMNVVTSNIIQVNVYHIILKWNFLYAIIIAGVHTVVIYMVHLFIL